MSQVLRAWAECERWDEFGLGIEGDPQPEIVSGLPGGGEEFVELDTPHCAHAVGASVRELQIVTEVFVQALGVKSSPRLPQPLSRLLNTVDALQGVGGSAFSEQGESRFNDFGGVWRATHSTSSGNPSSRFIRASKPSRS